jgi:hypothetical protein
MSVAHTRMETTPSARPGFLVTPSRSTLPAPRNGLYELPSARVARYDIEVLVRPGSMTPFRGAVLPKTQTQPRLNPYFPEKRPIPHTHTLFRGLGVLPAKAFSGKYVNRMGCLWVFVS